MIEVEVRGDLEYAIRQLKKKLQIDGIKRELKRREFYEKPSIRKRRRCFGVQHPPDHRLTFVMPRFMQSSP